MTTYTSEIHGASATSATNRTVLQIKAVNRAVKITEWGISFNGVTSSDVPVQIQAMIQTTQATGTTATINKRKPYAGTADAVVKNTVTVEGTYGNVFESYYLTPNGGLLLMQYPEDGEIIVPATPSWFGLVVNPPTSTVSYSAWIGWEEI